MLCWVTIDDTSRAVLVCLSVDVECLTSRCHVLHMQPGQIPGAHSWKRFHCQDMQLLVQDCVLVVLSHAVRTSSRTPTSGPTLR